jgi:large subunit ribosomal protein L18
MNSHKLDTKRTLAQNRKWRIRKTVKGTSDRPRLTLKLTNVNLHAQAIDDTVGKTVAAISSVTKKKTEKILPNVAGCSKLGEEFGAQLKKAGVMQVVFDRNGRRYHGTVKAFADGVRKGGVTF